MYISSLNDKLPRPHLSNTRITGLQVTMKDDIHSSWSDVQASRTLQLISIVTSDKQGRGAFGVRTVNPVGTRGIACVVIRPIVAIAAEEEDIDAFSCTQ